MKRIGFLLFFLVIIISCHVETRNVYLNTGTDYGMKPPQWTIGCEYDSLNYKVIDKIIEKLGNNYILEKTTFGEKYKWTKLIFLRFNKEPLDITITRRINKIKSKNGKLHELEGITFLY